MAYMKANQNGDFTSGARLNTVNSDMSKSIDSIYTPASTTTTSSSALKASNGMSSGAFNSVRRAAPQNSSDIDDKKTTNADHQNIDTSPPLTPATGSNTSGKEVHVSFQPVNFTNYRPKPMNLYQTTGVPVNNQFSSANGLKPGTNGNFKRDLIAEKKRSSIGKSPHNYYVSF